MTDEPLQSGLFRRMARSLRDARHLVVFTGAGVSAESGIGTFRDDDGLWTRFPPEIFANWEGLLRIAMDQPMRAAEFFLALLEPMVRAQPNAAHQAIAALERHQRVTVITQNVDGLHEMAGSSLVHTIHGTLYETVYLDGSPRGLLSRADVASVVQSLRPLCCPQATFEQLQEAVKPLMGMAVGGPYRPKIVMFNERMAEPDWTLAQQAVRQCDYLLSVGTSGTVYPAATLPEQARRHGATVAVIDPQPMDGYIWLEGRATTLVPAFVAEAFG
jgi:NAD-dependent deacetylase